MRTIKYEVERSDLSHHLNRPASSTPSNGTMQQELIDAYRCRRQGRQCPAPSSGDRGRARGFCAGADLSSGANTFDRDARRGPVKRLASGAVDYSDPRCATAAAR
jgi:enoyl-CoA hydratase/carnithine racemase